MDPRFSPAQNAKGSIRNQSVDWMKLILSVFVVAIHAELPLGIFSPFLRTAVPLFFLVSGYFYFRKVRAATTENTHTEILFRFWKRNMTLYAFWFVALLPITLYVRGWFSEGFTADALLRFLQSFFFNSTFRVSWYIMALCIGMTLIHALSRRLGTKTLLAVTFPIYLLCCLFTNYFGAVSSNEAVMGIYHGYLSVFSSLVNSFPASLFWLALANHLAAKPTLPERRRLFPVVFVGAALLVAEDLLVKHFRLQDVNDCYLSLLLICPAVFLLVLQTKTCAPSRLRPGATSTVIYTTHASLIVLLSPILKRVLPTATLPFHLALFACSLVLCIVLSRILFALENTRLLRFLRYSH